MEPKHVHIDDYTVFQITRRQWRERYYVGVKIGFGLGLFGATFMFIVAQLLKSA